MCNRCPFISTNQFTLQTQSIVTNITFILICFLRIGYKTRISKTNIYEPSPSKRLLASPRDRWWMSRSHSMYETKEKREAQRMIKTYWRLLTCVLLNVLSRFLYNWFESYVCGGLSGKQILYVLQIKWIVLCYSQLTLYYIILLLNKINIYKLFIC